MKQPFQPPDNHRRFFCARTLHIPLSEYCGFKVQWLFYWSPLKPTTMKRTKTHLQSHRIKAFTVTLAQIEISISRRVAFINEFGEVYRFPASLKKKNLAQYRKWQSAITELKTIEKKDL